MTEKDTGKPVEGAVIVLSWNRCWATPAGQSCDIFAVREALSDKEGNFYVSARAISFSIPVLTWIEEKRPIVFKPGYKFLVLEKKISKIALERVPTLLEVRKKEVDQAQQNYQTDVYATRIFKDKVFREEEFVECEGSIKPLRSSYFGRSARIWREFPLIQISPRDRDPRKVRQLIDDLDHEDAMVRKKAAQELGKMDIEEPELNALRRVIQARLKLPRANIKDLQNLAKIGTPLIPILFEEARRDPKSRENIAVILFVFDDPEALPLLIPYLEGNDATARRLAAFALTNYRDPRTIIPWVKVLGIEDIRYSAVQSLLRIGPSAAGPLIEALKDGNSKVRKEAAYILGNLEVQEATTPLIALARDGEAGVRQSVAFALGEIRDPVAFETLIFLLNDNDSEVQRSSAEALSKLRDRRAIDPLIERLKDPSWKAKIHAVEALASMPDQRVAQALIDTWKDSDRQVRIRAAEVLIFVGSPAVDPLCHALRSPDSYDRWRAAWMLGKIKDPRVVDYLVSLLGDKVTEVKWTATGALGWVTEPSARVKVMSTLVPMLNHEDQGISMKASESLKRLRIY